MPLAFTQEDFLVENLDLVFVTEPTRTARLLMSCTLTSIWVCET